MLHIKALQKFNVRISMPVTEFSTTKHTVRWVNSCPFMSNKTVMVSFLAFGLVPQIFFFHILKAW
jgi:hypothetical protein